MRQTTTRRIIDAPVDRVWSRATDIDGWPSSIRAITRVERLTEGGFGPGTRWRETRRMFGREATEEMWVSEVDPGRSYTAEAESHGAHYVSTFTFTPVAGSGSGQTEAVLTFGARPLGAVARILGAVTAPLVQRSVVKALRDDLDDLAAASESA